MAQVSTTRRERPLSPHLSIWRWGPHMFVSILHRATGSINALAGLTVLLWWLGSLANGPASYARFTSVMGSWPGLVVLVGISWSIFNHMCSGLRHFVLDTGAGYELGTNKTWSVISPITGIVLTALFWALIVLR